MAVLVWTCLHDSAPRYLADLCVPAASTDGRRQSRSAVCGVLLVPWTRTSTGQRSFAAYGPRTWNRLPLLFDYQNCRFLHSAQYSPVPALNLQWWVSCTIVRHCRECTACSAPTTNVQNHSGNGAKQRMVSRAFYTSTAVSAALSCLTWTSFKHKNLSYCYNPL